jgi:L-gulonate 3-dehydrogenase
MKVPEDIKSVAIIGAGFIGFSWAIVFACKGIAVKLYNRKGRTLDTVMAVIKENLDFMKEEGMLAEATAETAMRLIHTFDDLESAVANVDYVQEALPEDLELKQNVFAKLDELLPPDVIIGSSCSGLRMTDIAKKVKNHPERCLVAHPTNPPHIVPFMEIAADRASMEVKQAAYEFMQFVGQKPILCKEVYGYVLNRLQIALFKEAFYLLEQDICSLAAVDSAVTDGLGLRWAFTGPYGVEELNSASLAEGLIKYKAYFEEGFRELGDFSVITDSFVQKADAGIKDVMRGMTHNQYLKWRNQMVVRTRLLKGNARPTSSGDISPAV